MPIDIFEVLTRCRQADRIAEKDFDFSLFRATERLRKESGLKFDPRFPVNLSEGLADELFELGLRCYLEVGTWCMNTGRAVKFTEGEIRERIAAAPSRLFLGQGQDRFPIVHRRVEDTAETRVCAGIQTIPYSSDAMMLKISRGCARDRCVEGIWGGVVTRIADRHEVIAGTPAEIYAYRRNAGLLRRAVAEAGRPGMYIHNNAPTAIASVAMFDEEFGIRRTDSMGCMGVSELKISYDDLNRALFALAAGAPLRGTHTTTIGGFSGTVEGAAIATVAGALQAVCVQQGQLVGIETVPIKTKSKCTREGIWVLNIAGQALSRNTPFILNVLSGDHPAAGPGTRQYFYEAAAGNISNTVCGGHSLGGTRKFVVGSVPDYGTPLESRWMGEVCKAAVGMSREAANEIVKALLARYEGHYEDAPPGWTYPRLYDVEKEEPKPEYRALYEEVKEELAGLGLKFREESDARPESPLAPHGGGA